MTLLEYSAQMVREDIITLIQEKLWLKLNIDVHGFFQKVLPLFKRTDISDS